ncbi:MAG TPA: permease, partial [Acidimicrobiales bacterium]|nr:permease [Acidimicrobiales bacterium]
YGMVSSSCSYAASAMSKSLFVKGADFVASTVFMFASTNLVVELGIVLVVLMGWQFAAAEFVGGAIMIVLLTLLGGLWFRGRTVARARERLEAESAAGHGHGPEENTELQHQPWRTKLRSRGGWADAATYTMADLTMLRRELVIGYTIAGFLAVLVPTDVWNAVFLQGHGFWTSLENVIVGPFIAIISFVCSIGNVPLAAALWHGGISFGGVISFIFADLIAFPLLLIYRRYYGTRMTLRMLTLFWAVMSTAGLLTEGIFWALGAIPTTRPSTVAPAHFEWNYTTYLNIAFLALFGLLYWVYRNRERLGGGSGYALDPVCGMQVQTANAPASVPHDGHTVYFCSDHCRRRFEADPDRYARTTPSVPAGVHDHLAMASGGPGPSMPGAAAVDPHGSAVHVDPVCGMTVDPEHAGAHLVHDGADVWFCCQGCADTFAADPDLSSSSTAVAAGGPVAVPMGRTRPAPSAGSGPPPPSVVDPVCGMTVDPEHAGAHLVHDGADVWFCCQGCADAFAADPGAFRADANR